MKNYIKIGVSIVLAMITIGIAIYGLFTGKINFQEFRGITTKEAEVIDNNLNNLLTESGSNN